MLPSQRQNHATRPLSGYQPNRQSRQFCGLRWWVPLTDFQIAAAVSSKGVAAHYYGTRAHTSDDMAGSGVPQVTQDAFAGAAFDTLSADCDYRFDATPPLLPASCDRASFACWIRPTDVATSYRGVWQDGTQVQMLLSGGAAGHLTYVWEFTADEYNASSGLTLTADRWYLAAFTIEPTQAVVYAVDAVDGFRSWANVKTHNARTITTGPRIGTGTAAAWRGKVADFRAYDRTLSAAEVWALYDPATRWELYRTPRPRVFIEHVAGGGQSVTLGLAAESAAALALSAAKAADLGLAASSETALPAAAARSYVLGLASEAGSAPALAASKAAGLGLASEADAPLAIAASKAAELGLAAEAGSALGPAALKSLTLGLASSAEQAQPLGAAVSVTVGRAGEAGQALAISAAKAAALGVAASLETALTPAASKALTLGLAASAEVALAAAASGGSGAISVDVGQAWEANFALPLTVVVRAPTLRELIGLDGAWVFDTNDIDLSRDHDGFD